MLLAITREVSRAIGRCELTYRERLPIDVEAARKQHEQYRRCLASLGCTVVRLPEAPDLPDSVFVEDTAVVLDELALMTRPGAESRRAEVPFVAEALRPYRSLANIESPGILDGGDVLRLGRSLFVGLSRRSNPSAIRQMRELLWEFGYSVTGVRVAGCLHLKSAVTAVADRTLLINRQWVEAGKFGSMGLIDVDPEEPQAANALLIGKVVVLPSAFPKTAARLANHGIPFRLVDASELAKAEGGVTCCSLIVSVPGE